MRLCVYMKVGNFQPALLGNFQPVLTQTSLTWQKLLIIKRNCLKGRAIIGLNCGFHRSKQHFKESPDSR